MSNNNIVSLLSDYRNAVGIDYNSLQRQVVYSTSQSQLYLVRDIIMLMGGITSLAIREVAKSKKYTYRENPRRDAWSEFGKIITIGVISIGVWEFGKYIWKQYIQSSGDVIDNVVQLRKVKG